MQRTERGQTGIDFVIGMGVFLLTIAFILVFVPSMFAPFFGMGAGDALVSDRSATYLAEHELASEPGSTIELDPGAVNELFTECNGEELQDTLGIGTDRVNVTIADRDGPLDVGGVLTTCGPPPGSGETVSNRIVTIDGQQATLRVAVW